MSYDSDLNITLARQVSILEIIDLLLQYGWTVNNSVGGITYIPLGGDPEDIESIDSLSAWPEVQRILQEKEETNEFISLILTWQDTDIGGHLYRHEDGTVGFSWDMRRQQLSGKLRITDHNWYLLRVLEPLQGIVEGFEISDHF